MYVNLWINASAATFTILVLVGLVNIKLVISHLAINKYFKSLNPVGICFESPDKHFIGK